MEGRALNKGESWECTEEGFQSHVPCNFLLGIYFQGLMSGRLESWWQALNFRPRSLSLIPQQMRNNC